jgi:hypothetical protein
VGPRTDRGTLRLSWPLACRVDTDSSER